MIDTTIPPVRDKYQGPTFPNGWPVPTFMSVEQDGMGLTMEWCFGEQGKEGSWRVMYSMCLSNNPKDLRPYDVLMCRSTYTPFSQERTYDLAELDRWLKEAVETKEIT